jgi:poly(3-hydroxybutyrate) depolymerase
LKSGFILLAWAGIVAAQPLPALDAERTFTVSGLSAGAYMAVQVHVAHSTRVQGVGAIAGGPYYCAQGGLWTAYYNCMTPGAWWPLPSTNVLKAETEALAKAGKVDAVGNLAAARVWLFSGTEDRTVVPQVVQAAKAFYEGFKAKPVLIEKPAGHAMATTDKGNACPTSAPPFINDCDYDAAGELLQHLLGPLSPPREAGRLAEFDQGWVFIPEACEKERCRVHVAFHGCRQSAKEFAEGAGYNRWAGGNRLIVLYPQVKASWWPYNPRGCWDWWGYSGAQYATKEGSQIRAVMKMVDRLSGPRQ